MSVRILAQFISFLFHPVIICFIMPFLVVYRQTANGTYALKWQIFSSVFIFLALAIVFLERWRGVFTDSDFTNKKEREKFYMFMWPVAFVYMTTALFFKGILFPLSIIAVGIVVGMLAFMLVTIFVRVSTHSAVAAGFALSVGILFGQIAFLSVAWLPLLVGWSRLVLTKHRPLEIIIGSVLGVGITFITYLIGKYILLGTI